MPVGNPFEKVLLKNSNGELLKNADGSLKSAVLDENGDLPAGCCCDIPCSCCENVPETLTLSLTNSGCGLFLDQQIELTWNAGFQWGPNPFTDIGAWTGAGECFNPDFNVPGFDVYLYCVNDGTTCWSLNLSGEQGSAEFSLSVRSCDPFEISGTGLNVSGENYVMCRCPDEGITIDATVTE